jgi:hypothetical protein
LAFSNGQSSCHFSAVEYKTDVGTTPAIDRAKRVLAQICEATLTVNLLGGYSVYIKNLPPTWMHDIYVQGEFADDFGDHDRNLSQNGPIVSLLQNH